MEEKTEENHFFSEIQFHIDLVIVTLSCRLGGWRLELELECIE